MSQPDSNSVSVRESIITREPLPSSKKVYIPGNRYPELRVPMREIALSNGESVTVYDTSGPYTDPDQAIDVTAGLPQHRRAWVEARGDVESYRGREVQPQDDGLRAVDTALYSQAANLARQPMRARAGGNVSQLHYARRGIVTAEMEYIAIRENQRRDMLKSRFDTEERSARLAGAPRGARIPEIITPEFVRDEVARGRAIIPAN
ncbi:MAG TPA: phosphomethylpyrimidine synthase ThiC, partial [Porticoccaceae bacterium]|nr:phosphomethylpyrimidine synthase ThiC [Porticoccaceae bacterium]